MAEKINDTLKKKRIAVPNFRQFASYIINSSHHLLELQVVRGVLQGSALSLQLLVFCEFLLLLF